jgi:hypothetical protein
MEMIFGTCVLIGKASNFENLPETSMHTQNAKWVWGSGMWITKARRQYVPHL